MKDPPQPALQIRLLREELQLANRFPLRSRHPGKVFGRVGRVAGMGWAVTRPECVGVTCRGEKGCLGVDPLTGLKEGDGDAPGAGEARAAVEGLPGVGVSGRVENMGRGRCYHEHVYHVADFRGKAGE